MSDRAIALAAARLTALVLVPILVVVVPAPAHAYIGPGAGFAFLGSFFSLLVAFGGAVALFVSWPVRFALRSLRRRRSRTRARVRRMVVLGLDGLDPGLLERWMAEGHLPAFAELARRGSFTRLRTTYPAISPVAWSSFMTGVDPARHNIFDFLSRDLRTYKPVLSSSDVRGAPRTLRVGSWLIPVGRPLVRSMRRSKAFWTVLGEHRVPAHILRVPLTFPPERFAGALLSAMCIPDLRGTQGAFTFYTTDPEQVRASTASTEQTGGDRQLVRVESGRVRARLAGPQNPLRAASGAVEIPFEVELDTAGGRGVLRIQGRRYPLALREYSPWIRLRFRAGPGATAHGIARFYITSLAPHFGLYVTPINIDPARPSLPISFPRYFSVYLAKLIGEFATLGLAEDTWALNEGVIDEDAFVQQTLDHHREREAMFLNALDKVREGVVACVFDGTDRLQHMFYRYLDEDHPAQRGRSEAERAAHKDTILDMYRRCDALVGRVLERLAPDEHFIVLSDHGFQSFRRGVNLNSWLRDAGLLALRDGAEPGDWFANVDWARTRAYAFGLGGIYVNQRGREAQGCVEPGDETRAVKERLRGALSGLRDPEQGAVAIREVFDSGVVHSSGPYRDNGPDLIVGYDRGYRASWEGAVGRVTDAVFSDNTRAWSGDHCVDPRLVPGVLLSSRRIRSADPGIVDLAPTILAQFGIDKPAYMTGHVLEVEPAA